MPSFARASIVVLTPTTGRSRATHLPRFSLVSSIFTLSVTLRRNLFLVLAWLRAGRFPRILFCGWKKLGNAPMSSVWSLQYAWDHGSDSIIGTCHPALSS